MTGQDYECVINFQFLGRFLIRQELEDNTSGYYSALSRNCIYDHREHTKIHGAPFSRK